MQPVALTLLGLAAASEPSPYAGNPKGAAAAIMHHIVTHSANDSAKFLVWGYGQSIIHDAMLEADEALGLDEGLTQWVNPILDGFLSDGESEAFNMTHGLPVSPEFVGNSVGDKLGLFPHAYLHRAVHYNGSEAPPSVATDLEVARKIAFDYILEWPVKWKDGTYTRNYPGKVTSWPENNHQQYVWGDDSYMGLTLPARMAAAGQDAADGTLALFAAEQHALMSGHLVDPVTGVYFHGRNLESGEFSCCKWGRANGWAMMTHAEVLAALEATPGPAALAAKTRALTIFRDHAAALAKLQNRTDGRWHQLLDDSGSFLETSATAMYLVAMTEGLNRGWLEPQAFVPVVRKAWQGLAKVIHEDGHVAHICDGFGIHDTPAQYEACGQHYAKSQSGLGTVLKAAVLIAGSNFELVSPPFTLNDSPSSAADSAVADSTAWV